MEARTEEFRGYSTFAKPYALLFGASLAGGLLQRSASRARAERAPRSPLGSAIAGALEGDLRCTPLSDALSTEPSVNVIGARPRRRAGAPAGLPRRPSRHQPLGRAVPSRGRAAPREAPANPGYFDARCWPPARSSGALPAAAPLHTAALGGMAFSLAMLAERELRGEDVPGASDNASGAAVAMQLAAECAASPLEHTEVDVLITSCEESGMLGAQAYARRHALRAAETTFINFDTVGGPAPLTYILREGSATVNRPASPRLVEHARVDRRSAGPTSAWRRRARRPAYRPTRRRCARGGGRRSRCSRRATRSPTTTGPPTPTRTSTRPPSGGRSRPGASCCAPSTPRPARRSAAGC